MMLYPQTTYESEYECDNGHKFTYRSSDSDIMCPQCYSEWMKKYLPRAKRVSEPKQVLSIGFSYTVGSNTQSWNT